MNYALNIIQHYKLLKLVFSSVYIIVFIPVLLLRMRIWTDGCTEELFGLRRNHYRVRWNVRPKHAYEISCLFSHILDGFNE